MNPFPLDELIERGLLRKAPYVLLSHQAARQADDRSTLERLLLEDLPPTLLLTPEHGFSATAQDHEGVPSGRVLGIEAVSLYNGKRSSLKPPEELFAGIETLVIDLVDIGTRYYTFASTALYTVRSAAKAGARVIVLDRPNPIRADRIEGPLIEEGYRSFVGEFRVPIRHGKTLGELLVLACREENLDVDLTIIPEAGFRRDLWLDQTPFPWVPPSPNMPTLTTALLYPGLCLVEATNVSEGRGTAYPFHAVGAPFLDGRRLACEMQARRLPGLRFHPFTFRPGYGKWAGQVCHGFYIEVTDRDSVESFKSGVYLIQALRRLGGNSFAWRDKPYEFETTRPALDLLTGSDRLRVLLESDAELEGYLST